MKAFWDDRHDKEALDSICGFYENGKYFTTYDRTVEFLKIKEYVKPGLCVLEVGVGLGVVAKAFHDMGLVVSGLDVSTVALSKVKKYCENIYTLDDLHEIPHNYFDIIICNRVIQHVPTDLMIKELQCCIASLRATGIFALQFVSKGKIPDVGVNASIKQIMGGICYRTPKYLKLIIESCGGNCELVFTETNNHVFHIRKK